MTEEWERVKKRLKALEKEPFDPPSRSAVASWSLITHSLIAKALRLIMEKLENG